MLVVAFTFLHQLNHKNGLIISSHYILQLKKSQLVDPATFILFQITSILLLGVHLFP